MATGVFNGTLTIGGVSMQANISRTAVGSEGHEPAMAAGVAGTLSTRTSDVAGVLTVTAGHGFVTGDILAVFWIDPDTDAPSVVYGKYGTVSTNDITIADDVAGEYVGEFPADAVLPDEDTAVVVSKKVVSNVAVDATYVTMIGVNCDQPAVGVFGAGSEIYPVQIPVGYSPIYWDKQSGAATPLGSDPTMLVCYNGGIVAATFQYAMLLST